MDERFINLAQEVLRERAKIRDSVALEANIGQSALAGFEGIAEQRRIDHLVESDRQVRLKNIETQEEKRQRDERNQQEVQQKRKTNIAEQETRVNTSLLRSFNKVCLPRVAESHDEDRVTAKEPKTFRFLEADEERLRALQSSVFWLPVSQTKRHTEQEFTEKYGGFYKTVHKKREVYGVHPVFVIGSRLVARNEAVVLGVSAVSREGKSPSDYTIPLFTNKITSILSFLCKDMDYVDAVERTKAHYYTHTEISKYNSQRGYEGTKEEFVRDSLEPSTEQAVDVHRIIFRMRNFRKFEKMRQNIADGSFSYSRVGMSSLYHPDINQTVVSEQSLGSLSTSGAGDSQKIRLFYNTRAEKITTLTDEMMATHNILGHLVNLALAFRTSQHLDDLLESQRE